MSYDKSFGFVETLGLVPAIEAADAMAKAARVDVKTVGNADAGLISVICEGDLAACQAAVDAGKAAAGRLGDVVGTNIIARPDDDTNTVVSEYIDPLFKKSAESAPEKAPKGGAKKK
jgi:microcompartment protein CcmL/EutN